MHPTDSDESRDSSSVSDSDSDKEEQPQHGEKSSSHSRSNSSSSRDSDTRKQVPDKPKSTSGSPSSVDIKTNKSSHDSTPRHSESRSQSPKSPISRSVSPKSVKNSPDRSESPPNSTPRRPSSPDQRYGSNSPQLPNPINGRSKTPSPDRTSVVSSKSDSSRTSKNIHEAANLDDGNTSDSSESSEDNMLRHRKNIPKDEENKPEDISDIDSEQERKEREEQERQRDAIQKESVANLQMAHEDLSDVSDLDAPSEDDVSQKSSEIKQEVIEPDVKRQVVENSEEAEEPLDFEAEDGECAEPEKEDSKGAPSASTSPSKVKQETETLSQTEEEAAAAAIKKELEEGELSDEDEARPEETEPRPVCRFFSRGQCTWGASCRFLHPGVTDKGNYTMFEMIRPVVPGEFGPERMLYGRPEPPPVESAWERGLRTAKEMLRKSMKRKEQDIDFEEKKMNLSLTQEELDKENGYYTRGPSPEPRYAPVRHVVPVDYGPPPPVRPQPEEYYGRRQVIYEPDYVPPPRERSRVQYREVAPHRVHPEYYPPKYEEEVAVPAAKVRKPKREVIVQRVEEERRPGRGDEWSDPWMRSKSPVGRKVRKRSYSSGSSYSSSSSSGSSSGSSRSSYRSRSAKRRRTLSRRHKRQVSPSVIVSERKAANERAALMNPPAPRKKAPSPGMMRAGAQNPPAPSMKVDQFGRTRSKLAMAAALARVKGRARPSHSRSSSGSSSGSSSSDSDSSASSSSSSRDRSPPRRPTGVDLAMALKAKAIDALKSGGSEKRQIKLNLKTASAVVKKDLSQLALQQQQMQGKKRPGPSSPPSLASLEATSKAASKKASSRREELLKQLKAVEDAIAKKRSKVN